VLKHRPTVLTLLTKSGSVASASTDRIRNVPVKDLQADEIWSFVKCKEKTKGSEQAHDDTIGDAWPFTCIERNSKLIVAWHQGARTSKDTLELTEKISQATVGHFQITTDGFTPYRDTVEYSLGMRCDFAQLVKVYASPREGQQRYSPAEIVEAVPVPRIGNPDPAKICTSRVERQNLTMRMQIRRLTRLTNGFSKTLTNHRAAIALYFCWYNYCRPHRSLRTTPAMAANLTDHIWTIRELVEALP
jgi:IS1 family transposase